MAEVDTSGFLMLTEDAVESFRVADLKSELSERDLDFPKRAKKAELKAILLEYVQNSVVAGAVEEEVSAVEEEVSAVEEEEAVVEEEEEAPEEPAAETSEEQSVEPTETSEEPSAEPEKMEVEETAEEETPAEAGTEASAEEVEAMDVVEEEAEEAVTEEDAEEVQPETVTEETSPPPAETTTPTEETTAEAAPVVVTEESTETPVTTEESAPVTEEITTEEPAPTPTETTPCEDVTPLKRTWTHTTKDGDTMQRLRRRTDTEIGLQSGKKMSEPIVKAAIPAEKINDVREPRAKRQKRLPEEYVKDQLLVGLEKLEDDGLREYVFKLIKNNDGALASLRAYMDTHQSMCKLFIRGLVPSQTTEDIESIYGKYNVKEVRLLKDRQTGQSKNMGFLLFANATDTMKALERPERRINDRTIHINLAVKPNNRNK